MKRSISRCIDYVAVVTKDGKWKLKHLSLIKYKIPLSPYFCLPSKLGISYDTKPGIAVSSPTSNNLAWTTVTFLTPWSNPAPLEFASTRSPGLYIANTSCNFYSVWVISSRNVVYTCLLGACWNFTPVMGLAETRSDCDES